MAEVIVWFPDSDDRYHIELRGSDTTLEFKQRVSHVSNIPDENFNISFEGTVLKEGEAVLVADSGVGPDSELVATITPECIAKNKLLKERRDLTEKDFFREVAFAGDQILTYVEAGFDVNLQNVEGLTPLALACECRRTRIEDVEGLLRHGASPDITDYADVTPLMRAATNIGDNYILILSRLLEEEFIDINAKSYIGSTALAMVCKNPSVGNLEALQMMLSHPKIDLVAEAESKKETLLHSVSLNKGPKAAEMMSTLLQLEIFSNLVNERDTHKNTALMYAVSNLSDAALEMTEMLIAHGADPTIFGLSGVTPIMRCCRSKGGYNKIDILKLILDPELYTKHGSNLEQVVNICRHSKDSALTEAIRLENERPDVVSMLLAAGADVSVGEDSVLISCCEIRSEDAVEVLRTLMVVPNIDLNIQKNEKTPLTAAAQNTPTNSYNLTEALLSEGARPSETETRNLRRIIEETQPEPYRTRILELYDAIQNNE
eukprot:TRINITY_DN733_c3_g3_i1.p1 TRINITY_DN733_c3_g3~~TRINITY_DN733_c3_g3_i1.p1  ORF type:complete len:490 (+),score=121.21 TRINITY_DN733_c3_g3_i1:85-1554(+)